MGPANQPIRIQNKHNAQRRKTTIFSLIFSVIILILDIWAVMNILGSGASVLAKILWTLLVIFAPIVGFLIWYVAGPKK